MSLKNLNHGSLMVKMIMTQPKGLYFSKIYIQQFHVSHDPLGIRGKIDKARMRFAIYYGFDLVGQTMLSMQGSFKNRSSTHMPPGNLIMW